MVKILAGSLPACRFSQRSAAGCSPGSHLAASWWEQGGTANTAVLPEGCGGLRGWEPNDPDQHCCLFGAITFPPQHIEKKCQRHQVSRPQTVKFLFYYIKHLWWFWCRVHSDPWWRSYIRLDSTKLPLFWRIQTRTVKLCSVTSLKIRNVFRKKGVCSDLNSAKSFHQIVSHGFECEAAAVMCGVNSVSLAFISFGLYENFILTIQIFSLRLSSWATNNLEDISCGV